MPLGVGNLSKLGIKEETTAGTRNEPDVALPFVSESFQDPNDLQPSQSILGDSMVSTVAPGVRQPSGGFVQELDPASNGYPLAMWNGMGNGAYTAAALSGYGITSAPTGTPGSGNGTTNPKAFLKTVDSGANYTSYLTEVTGAGFAELDSLDTLANGDSFWVGLDTTFAGVTLTMTANVNGTASVLSAHYHNTSGVLTALSGLTDGTDSGGATLAQTGNVTWPVPSDWKAVTVNSQKRFWVRFTVSAALDSSTEVDTCVCMLSGLADGDYYYYVASVLQWTDHAAQGGNSLFIMPRSAEIASAATAGSGDSHIVVAWTNPTSFSSLPEGFTYYGTVVYRSAVNGASDSETFYHFVEGTAASWTDGGNAPYADSNVSPWTSSIYTHEYIGAPPVSGTNRLPSFTTQISKNVGDDEAYTGCIMDGMTITVSEANSIAQVAWTAFARNSERVDGEFSATATPRQHIMGHKAVVTIDGTADCKVESFELSGQNGAALQFGLCGVNTARDVSTTQNRQINVNFTMAFEDRVMWNKIKNQSEFAMRFKVWGQPIQATGSTLYDTDHGVTAFPFPYIMEIIIYRMIASGTNPVAGGDQIKLTVNAQAFKDLVEGTEMKIRLYNTTSTYVLS